MELLSITLGSSLQHEVQTRLSGSQICSRQEAKLWSAIQVIGLQAEEKPSQRPTALVPKPTKQTPQPQEKLVKSNMPPVPRLDLLKQAQALKPQAAKVPADKFQQVSSQAGTGKASANITALGPAPVSQTAGLPKATATAQPPLPTKQLVSKAQSLQPLAKSSQPPLPSTAQVQSLFVNMLLDNFFQSDKDLGLGRTEDSLLSCYLPDAGSPAII